MTHPHQHIHLRKRIHQKKQKYPHPNRWISLLDRFVIVFGFLNGLATIPQVLEIWIGKDASGVSLLSWSYYVAFAILLLIYGLVHKEKPIIITYSIGTVMYTLIVIGVIIYG